MPEITTRRAIEVCLSRLRMPRGVADNLCHHLAVAIHDNPPNPDDDIDALRAALVQIDELAQGVDDFPRKSLLVRLELIREVVAARK